MGKHKLAPPILSPMLQNWQTAALISGLALLQGGLTACGLSAWRCPMLQVLGVPCPGCGLTRAMLALLRGDWHTAWTLHAFAPLFLLSLGLVLLAALLPERPRQALAARVEAVEQGTGFAVIMFVALVGYWAFRLYHAPAQFTALIKG